MRLVFMGSAELAVPSLRSILEAGRDEVVGVVTQPDRPAGRNKKLTPCPLKAFAEQKGLTIFTPEKVGSPESVEALRLLSPDLFIVAAYGQYIPARIIDLAPHAAINVHPSLLPKYRGAAPIQWAIANGDEMSGVSIIDVAQKMDAGDILRQETYPIAPDDTSASLHDKLAEFGAELLLKAIEDIREGNVHRMPQDDELAVDVRKLNKDDSPIDWSQPAHVIYNRIRAFNPWPGSTCLLPDGTVLKVWCACLEEGQGSLGELLDEQLLVVATGSGAIRLLEVQPPGKTRMPADAFLRGHPLVAGAVLG